MPYSIQWLTRFKPAWLRYDLLTLLDLLRQGKFKPLIAHRLPFTRFAAHTRCWAKAACSAKSYYYRTDSL
jgi:hypothetical protein